MNKVQLLGRIGKKLELRYLPNGDAVLNIVLATEKEWTDKQTTEKTKKTEWHRLVAFKHTAELIVKYYKVGDILFAEGEIGTRKWTDAGGQDQYTTEITINQLDFSKSSTLLIGNIGIDLVLRETPSGGKVLNFTLATKNKWKNKNTGLPEEKTEWHSIVAFGSQAELISKHFNKGSKIAIDGELQTKRWTPAGGIEQFKTEIKTNRFHFIDNKKPEHIPHALVSNHPATPIHQNVGPAPTKFIHSNFDDFDDFDDETPL